MVPSTSKNPAAMVLLLVIVATTARISGAADAPVLTRADAQKILESIYQNVSVGAIVANKATGGVRAIAIGLRGNDTVKIERDFYFDSELGWFLYEYDDDGGRKKPAKLQIWSQNGYREVKPELNLLAKSPADIEKLRAELNTAMDLEDNDKALTVLDKLSKAEPFLAFIYGPKKFKVLLQRPDKTAAYALAGELLETFKDNPAPLTSIASALVDPDNPVKDPDLALAEKAALRAKELMAGKTHDDLMGRIQDTLARIYFGKGDLKKAIELETSAIDNTKLESAREKLEARLKEFKIKQSAQIAPK